MKKTLIILMLLMCNLFCNSQVTLSQPLIDTEVYYILENNSYDLYNGQPCVRAKIPSLYILKKTNISTKHIHFLLNKIIKYREHKKKISIPKKILKDAIFYYLGGKNQLYDHIRGTYQPIGNIIITTKETVLKYTFEIYTFPK